jgi:hypothetical protein
VSRAWVFSQKLKSGNNELFFTPLDDYNETTHFNLTRRVYPRKIPRLLLAKEWSCSFKLESQLKRGMESYNLSDYEFNAAKFGALGNL